jgi:glucose-6-phosphate isomerase
VKNNKKNFVIEDNINKKYFKKNLFLRNKVKLNKIIENIFSNIDNKKNTFHIFSKKFILNLNKLKLRKFEKYKIVVVIGMGGSVLGAHSIYSFLERRINRNFIFIDNLDQQEIAKVKKEVSKKKSLFIIISKSGNTIETLINSNLLKDKINSENTIIITEKKNNLLNKFAKKNKIVHIEHRDYIGGRYSVLSEVGMIPAYFMGLNVNSFRKSLLSFFKSKQKLLSFENIIKLSHIYNLKKIKSIIFLNYVPQLNYFLYWYQQLIAESLGKQGKGVLPIVSPAPRDHHSLLQLYLDGPQDKLIYIFSSSSSKKIKIKKNIFGKLFKFAENRQLSEVIESQKKALVKVLKKKKIPFKEFKINKFNEEVLGELFSYFMLETALVGKLIGVNPFDQPAVEEVKTLTKQFLS